jgi:hypothetical protein
MAIVATLLFLGFLVLLGGIAWAGFKLAAPGKNATPLGCAAGCALGFGLFLLGAFALAGFIVLLSAGLVHSVAENPPIERVHVTRPSLSDDGRFHVRFDLTGRLAEILDDEDVLGIVQEAAGDEAHVSVDREATDEGGSRVHVEVDLPGRHRDGNRIRERIEERLREYDPIEQDEEPVAPSTSGKTREY